MASDHNLIQVDGTIYNLTYLLKAVRSKKGNVTLYFDAGAVEDKHEFLTVTGLTAVQLWKHLEQSTTSFPREEG